MTSLQAVLNLKEQIELLEHLLIQLKESQSKIQILDAYSTTQQFLNAHPSFAEHIKNFSTEQQFAIKSFLALGQGSYGIGDWNALKDKEHLLSEFVQLLMNVEHFYCAIGGIIGYHLTILKLLDKEKHQVCSRTNYIKPEGFDLHHPNPEVYEAVRIGIEKLKFTAEIYPVGGAGDRLNLKDNVSGDPLPAAQLQFCGRSLLEGLVRDLQGREFLYYKLFGKQCVTPIALMTSHEKNNSSRMLKLLEESQWYGRSKEKFKIFVQMLVPVITVDGVWTFTAPLQPILKPGGHGVLWKEAENQGVFDWLEKWKCSKAIVRQINNPVGGLDIGLLALSGLGWKENRKFGFASCERLLNSPEGMNVLCERKTDTGYQYGITNIEYTDFERYGIKDQPEKTGSPYSRFPSNTNILFADLQALKDALKRCPLPGMLVNMKSKVAHIDSQGNKQEKNAGRLETIMQNIADHIVDNLPHRASVEERKHLSTFLTYNERKKTISVVKQAFEKGKTFLGTPEGGFYELMQNYRDLLEKYCGMKLPSQESEEDYLVSGSAFVALFHPALGVVNEVIGQKIRGGSIEKGSELILEVAEAEIENLHLDGSLVIEAENLMGNKDAHEHLVFNTHACGKCTLKNVTVKNQGVKFTSLKDLWQQNVERTETLHITLHGNAEFYAENVLLEGNIYFDVPNGHRLVVYQQGNETAWHYEELHGPTWHWQYFFDQQERIKIEKKLL